ncbi:unnamed protein product [Aureobasidium uvarum]|uniref:Uncharacterized protein n=1 Tax=Aureobasidium uvarum TaxID=2773716 RepID=A0A9N8KSJ2_9PEZI|nr:unnamed protein product [Aureobasidium uvarum]
MNDYKTILSMRVTRLTYQSESSPFGLWTWPSSLDGPSFAPCYAPYGEQSPPIDSHPAIEQTTIVKSIESDVLKPWEKGSKSGKKIKKGRGPKSRVVMSPGSDATSTDMSNSDNSSSNEISTAATSTRTSVQNSPASRARQYPVLDIAGVALPRLAPYNNYHPDTAQAAIAQSRSSSVNYDFLTPTDAGYVERKHDRVDNEAPTTSFKAHRRE